MLTADINLLGEALVLLVTETIQLRLVKLFDLLGNVLFVLHVRLKRSLLLVMLQHAKEPLELHWICKSFFVVVIGLMSILIKSHELGTDGIKASYVQRTMLTKSCEDFLGEFMSE